MKIILFHKAFCDTFPGAQLRAAQENAGLPPLYCQWTRYGQVPYIINLIRVALEENLKLLFKTILHHDALS